ncbi:metal ABC transporter ATP-binding protein [candidate division KSB1 bacterium]|nr:metal ABC transporter ATP-binding protein [candidate division KSB1 bacterium]MBL7094829.1 metal ABC transporter ATP-binding protein [candidate division KSB1 bacterium]
MKTPPIIQIKNVTFSYNTIPVLENVNLEIFERDFLGLIGPNGGGKTTLLKLILGLIQPDKGTIKVFDRSPKEGRQFIGYVPQLITFDFDFPISVLEVVLMGKLRKRGIGKRFHKEDVQLAIEALKKVGMDEYKETEIGNLSGGQQQRVFIARALSTDPKLLLLDEPVASIDPIWQQEFYNLLNELNKNLAIVLVTHDISVISTHIDKIACVNRKIHYHGTTKDGIHKISEMYHCPVDLVAHSVPHRSLHGHNTQRTKVQAKAEAKAKEKKEYP